MINASEMSPQHVASKTFYNELLMAFAEISAQTRDVPRGAVRETLDTATIAHHLMVIVERIDEVTSGTPVLSVSSRFVRTAIGRTSIHWFAQDKMQICRQLLNPEGSAPSRAQEMQILIMLKSMCAELLKTDPLHDAAESIRQQRGSTDSP